MFYKGYIVMVIKYLYLNPHFERKITHGIQWRPKDYVCPIGKKYKNIMPHFFLHVVIFIYVLPFYNLCKATIYN